MTTAGWQDWYRGRRVLVTGHTGFKGCWLSLWLRTLGAEVTGLSLAPQSEPGAGLLFAELGLGRGLDDRRGDIRDLDRVRAVLAEVRPEAVFHLAAQSLVLASYEDPIGTYATNVMGTAHVLEAARGVDGLRAVVVVTSDKCYENEGSGRPFAEGDPMGGHDPYSSSKGCAEIVTQTWRRSFFGDGPGVASVRAGNVIGGGDWAENRLVPDLMRAAAAGETATIRRPASTRPWQHVLEPLSAYLVVGHALATGVAGAARAWNVGPDPQDSRPVREIAARLAQHWPRIRYALAEAPSGPHEAASLSLDCRLITERMGWRPALDLDAVLRLTAEWYRARFEAPETTLAVTEAQIRDYAALRHAHAEAAA